jgi:hypothetical protein
MLSGLWYLTKGFAVRQEAQIQVKPGTTAVLSYNDNPLAAQSITIQSSYYVIQSFRVDTFTCRINHDGNTGKIVVNDPADGDVVTCGQPGYSCTN